MPFEGGIIQPTQLLCWGVVPLPPFLLRKKLAKAWTLSEADWALVVGVLLIRPVASAAFRASPKLTQWLHMVHGSVTEESTVPRGNGSLTRD